MQPDTILTKQSNNSNLQTSVENSLSTPGDLFALVTGRLAAGSPFSRPRSAWLGYEVVARVNGWQVGIGLIGKEVFILANTATKSLKRLPVATHRCRDRYDVTCDRAGFDSWIAQVEVL